MKKKSDKKEGKRSAKMAAECTCNKNVQAQVATEHLNMVCIACLSQICDA